MKTEKQKKTKKIVIKFLKKALVLLFLFITVYNLTYTIFSLFSKRFSFLGINFYIVSTNSMRDKLNKNDLVITRKTKKLNVDDIITYFKSEDYRIARITNVHETSGNNSYVIKADKNYYIEEVLQENVQAKMLFKVPYGGIFINIIRSKILTAIILFFIILLIIHNRNIKSRNRRRRELKQTR